MRSASVSLTSQLRPKWLLPSRAAPSFLAPLQPRFYNRSVAPTPCLAATDTLLSQTALVVRGAGTLLSLLSCTRTLISGTLLLTRKQPACGIWCSTSRLWCSAEYRQTFNGSITAPMRYLRWKFVRSHSHWRGIGHPQTHLPKCLFFGFWGQSIW